MDERDDPSPSFIVRDNLNQFAVAYLAKELFQVPVNGIAVAFCNVLLTFTQCLVGVAPWPEPVTVR